MDREIAQSRPAEILLVEDSDIDVKITRKAFEKAHLLVNLHHVVNGRECLAFLRKQGDYGEMPTPDIILLDLNMPVMDGREVMAEIAADGELCRLPVIALTTSADERDVLHMYHLRCSSYIVKPVDFDQFLHVIQDFGRYWFAVVVLPPKG